MKPIRLSSYDHRAFCMECHAVQRSLYRQLCHECGYHILSVNTCALHWVPPFSLRWLRRDGTPVP
jgi:hypothetical protein